MAGQGRKKGDGRGNQGGGRRPGTPNKITRDVRNVLVPVITGYLEGTLTSAEGASYSLEQDLRDMDPVDRAKIMKDLVPYVIPKLSSVEVKGEVARKTFAEELDDMEKVD